MVNHNKEVQKNVESRDNASLIAKRNNTKSPFLPRVIVKDSLINYFDLSVNQFEVLKL